MQRKMVLCCAFVLSLAAFCAAQNASSDGEAAVRAADARWLKAAASRDLSGTVAAYTNNAIMMEPGVPAFVGKQAIREQWQREMSDKAYALTWSVAALEVSGDLAYTRGSYAVTYTGDKGMPVNEVGKYIVVWKRVGKEWKVASEIYNADGPPKPR